MVLIPLECSAMSLGSRCKTFWVKTVVSKLWARIVQWCSILW